MRHAEHGRFQKAFAANLKTLLELPDCNVAEIARRSGVSRSHLYCLAKSENSLTLDNAELIANAFGYDLPEFLEKRIKAPRYRKIAEKVSA